MLTEKPLHWLEERLFDSAVKQILQIAVCKLPHRDRRLWVVNFYQTFNSGKDLAFVTKCSTFEESLFVSVFLAPEKVGLFANAVEGNNVHTLEPPVAQIKPPLYDVPLFNLEV